MVPVALAVNVETVGPLPDTDEMKISSTAEVASQLNMAFQVSAALRMKEVQKQMEKPFAVSILPKFMPGIEKEPKEFMNAECEVGQGPEMR